MSERWDEQLRAGGEVARQAQRELRAAAEAGQDVSPALPALAGLLADGEQGFSAALLLEWLGARQDLGPIVPALVAGLAGGLRPQLGAALLAWAGDDLPRRRRVAGELRDSGVAGDTAERVARVCGCDVPRRRWSWGQSSVDTAQGLLRWACQGRGSVDQEFEAFRARGPAPAVHTLFEPGSIPREVYEDLCRTVGAWPPPPRASREDVVREAAATVAALTSGRASPPCVECRELAPALRFFLRDRRHSRAIERCGACGRLFEYVYEYDYLVNGASEESETRTAVTPDDLQALLVRARLEDGMEWGTEAPGDGRVLA